jgi:hypothetical protein
MNHLPASRPLPRSLDPLHDESVVGYTLRLAYQAGCAPSEITTRTGLRRSETSGLSLRTLHDLDGRQLQEFCTATSLTSTEARRLLLAELGPRYAPLDATLTKGNSAQALITGNAWASFRNTRYCPQCLAGDSTEIQRLLGGAWRRLWRVPAVFACRVHQRLLSTRCPGCDQLAQASKAGHLIPQLTVEGLHPLQCRINTAPKGTRISTPCGARYDSTEQPSGLLPDARTLAVVLRLQDRIENLLTADPAGETATFGWRTPVGLYFSDLWIMSALVFLTWPECRALAPTPALAVVMEDEADQRHHKYRLHKGHGKQPRSRAYSISTESPLAAAAVLGIAEQLLAIPDEQTAFETLKAVIERSISISPTLSYQFRTTRRVSVPFRETLRYDRRPWTRHSGPHRADQILKHPGMSRATTSRQLPRQHDS